MQTLSNRKVYILLMALIGLHLLIVALFYFSVIPDPDHPQGTFRFHHGGDEVEYFRLAQSILRGSPMRSRMTLGYPLTLIPWIIVTQAEQANQIVQPIALINALILFPIAEILLFQIAKQLTRSTLIGLLTVLIWVLMPVGLYLAMAVVGRGGLGASWAVHLIWAQMLSEPITTLLTLLSFWLLLYIIDQGSTRSAIWVASNALGIICGLLLLIRLNSLLSFSAIAIALIWLKRWRVLTVTLVWMVILFIPQLVYNAANFGSIFTTGYQVLTSSPNGLFNATYIVKVLTSPKYAVVIWLVGLLLFGLIGTGLYFLYRRNPLAAMLIGIWLICYIAFFSVYYYSWVGGLSRFLIPSYPALALLLATLFTAIINRFLPNFQTVHEASVALKPL